MNTASERIPAYALPPEFQPGDSDIPPSSLRIDLPRPVLTVQQLTELAGRIRRFSPRYALRLRSSTQLEIVMPSPYLHWPSEQIFDTPGIFINTRNHKIPTDGYTSLRIHVRGTHLHVRQLRVLAALMYTEGVRTIRVVDSETLLMEKVWHGREAVLRLGLREAGLITV